MTNKTRPTQFQLINYIQHDESTALYGEGFLINLSPGQFLVRVEASAATHPGNWFHGPFYNLDNARSYAKYLADLGKSRIRQVNALPQVWEGGKQGNKIEVIRLYQIIYPTPAISSVVAPQREGGTVMARPEHLAALLSGNIMKAAEYKGQGQQLSVPVTHVSKHHGFDLVKRIDGEELRVTKL